MSSTTFMVMTSLAEIIWRFKMFFEVFFFEIQILKCSQ
jgi:hypothetical protein